MKNKLFLLGLIILFSYTISFAQTNMVENNLKYNTHYLNGEVKMREGKYDEAIHYFSKAAEIHPAFHKPYYQLGVCYSQLENYEKAYDSFVKMIGTDCSYSIKASSTKDFESSEYYRKMIRQQDSLLNIARNKFDTNFYNTLSGFIDKKIGSSTAVVSDTAILRELIDICIEYGEFPSYLNVGMEIYRKMSFLIALNITNLTDEAYHQKVIKLVKEGIEKGGVEVSIYAMIEDMRQLHFNKPQKYGVLTNLSLITNYPSITELNENRRLIGLPEIELQAKSTGVDLEKLIPQ